MGHTLTRVNTGVNTLMFTSLGQFHQHFTPTYFADIFLPKSQEAKTYVEKICTKHFCTKKRERKMSMKLTRWVDFNKLCVPSELRRWRKVF